jgi:hypothetical protein
MDRTRRETRLSRVAETYVDTVMENIVREYPVAILLTAVGPGRIPSHRELHPAFFGCFDWHSCVELHWVAVRLLRLFPDLPNAARARALLRGLLTRENLETELAFFQLPHQQGWERPYGWGWFLTLHYELATWDDPDGQAWAEATRPLALHIAAGFKSWLPKLNYPVRCGFHPNTAFALARSLNFARASDPELTALIEGRAMDWFGADIDYPAHYEPSGSDFLSATLTEAELMAAVLELDAFRQWFDRFLPHLGVNNQRALLEPAVVSDPSDGHIAHLHGLNLYRAFGMVRVAEQLPEGDARQIVLLEAAERHAAASLPLVAGSDYMVEHWLAAYATLLLTM